MLQSGNTIVAVSKAVQENFRATLHSLCRFGFEANGDAKPVTADLLDSVGSSLASEHLAMLEQLPETATLPESVFARVIGECREQLSKMQGALIDDFRHGTHDGARMAKEPSVSVVSQITNSPGARRHLAEAASHADPGPTRDLPPEARKVDGANDFGPGDETLASRQQAVREAARVLWPPHGIRPKGLGWKRRDKLINDELGRTGRSVSSSTIRRALRNWLPERN
jgi:hypothetical protein